MSPVAEPPGVLSGGPGGAGSSRAPQGPATPLPGARSAAPLTLSRKAARSCTLSWTMAADHSQERVAPLLGPGWWPWALQRTCLALLSEGGSLGSPLLLPQGRGAAHPAAVPRNVGKGPRSIALERCPLRGLGSGAWRCSSPGCSVPACSELAAWADGQQCHPRDPPTPCEK